MKFTIRTYAPVSFAEADKTFDRDYLLQLNPQFPPFKILRFDGMEKGNEIHIEMNFGLFKQSWKYLIAEKTVTDREWSFVDEGLQMPFFLKSWHHLYKLGEENGQLCISDTVTFKTPFFLFDYLMWPWLYLHFKYRRPVYKKRFQKKQA